MKKGFTMIELLIVLSIIAVIGTVVVLLINPTQLVAQAKDAQRVNDIKRVDTVIQLNKNSLDETLDESLVLPNIVYVSLPDINGNLTDNCGTDTEYSLPILASGWQYRCAASLANLRKVDNTGWIPINFTSVTSNPLTSLPVDPLNNASNYYTYSSDGVLAVKLTSDKYLNQVALNDGGNSDSLFETAPIMWGGPGLWSELTANGAAGSPPARYRSKSVWDSANNRLLMFGGYTGSYQNDLWSYTSAGSWVQLTAQGAPGSPTARSSHGATWDSTNNRLLVFGGDAGGTRRNDLWSYTSAGGWTQLTAQGAAGSPLPRYYPSATWDSVNNRLLVFGGDTGTYYNDLWCYSGVANACKAGSAANAWSEIITNGVPSSPSGRFSHSATWDNANNRLLMFGGYDSSSRRNDLWSYTSAGGWTQLTAQGAAGSPLARFYHSADWDNVKNRLLVFGGSIDMLAANDRNDLWCYSGVANACQVGSLANTWSQLIANGTAGSPMGREGHSSSWDSLNKRLLIFGGSWSDGSFYHNDLWAF